MILMVPQDVTPYPTLGPQAFLHCASALSLECVSNCLSVCLSKLRHRREFAGRALCNVELLPPLRRRKEACGASGRVVSVPMSGLRPVRVLTFGALLGASAVPGMRSSAPSGATNENRRTGTRRGRAENAVRAESNELPVSMQAMRNGDQWPTAARGRPPALFALLFTLHAREGAPTTIWPDSPRQGATQRRALRDLRVGRRRKDIDGRPRPCQRWHSRLIVRTLQLGCRILSRRPRSSSRCCRVHREVAP